MTTAINPANDISGKVLAKRVIARDRTTLILTYKSSDAAALRRFVQQIRLKGDRKPTMSLIAGRAMEVYRLLMERPGVLESETAVLDRMVTPVPKPAKVSKRTLTPIQQCAEVFEPKHTA
jgi:hypothetical protein